MSVQISQTHCQNDALGAVSSLRSSLSNRCPGGRFEPKVAQKLAEAPKPSIFIVKTMPLEQIRPQGHPETCQSSQTIHFHYQKRWLGTDFEPKVAQMPARAPKPPISSSKRCPGSHFESKAAQKLARALKPSIFIVKTMPWE